MPVLPQVPVVSVPISSLNVFIGTTGGTSAMNRVLFVSSHAGEGIR